MTDLRVTERLGSPDVWLAWAADADAETHRVYTVDGTADLPARGEKPAATERCRTPDGSGVSCVHVDGLVAPSARLLLYQVVGACGDDPAREGPR